MKTEELAREVIARLKGEGKTLATAESCTGGLLGKLLTDVPGASSVYKGGVISYVNEVKHRLLGVDQQTLDVCTAVSRETAHEMSASPRPDLPDLTATAPEDRSGWSMSRSTWRAFPTAASCTSPETARKSAPGRRTRRFPCCWNSCNRICLEPDR